MPTASTEGKEERVCEVCGEKETRTLEKTELVTPAELSAELLEFINNARAENSIEKLQLATEGSLVKIAEYLAEGDTDKYNAELEALKPEHTAVNKADGYTAAKEAFEVLMKNEEYKKNILNGDFKFISMHITVTDGKFNIVMFFADRSAPAA